MMQVPNFPNPYMQPVQPQSYNAVKIDVHNPSVIAPGVAQQAPMNTQGYAQPTMPYYQYPQAPVYQYPQAPVQPYYMPVQQQPIMVQPQVTQQQPAAPQVAPQVVTPQAPAEPTQAVLPQTTQAPQAEAAQAVATEIAPVKQEVPAPAITQPAETKASEAPADVKAPEVVPPVPLEPQVDLNAFISKLTNKDYEVQAAAMEEIANMVKENPEKAVELLDVKVMDTLNNIVNADSSKLAGPTQEQIAARQKLLKNEQMTDAEKNLATTITPMEQAERNKSYAMFTTAIMQKLYTEEVAKLTNTSVPLTELPGAVSIVEQLKNNPNPMVRASAIEALSYIQQPAYKADLNTIFSIAKNDQDKGVQEAATIALDKLNNMAEGAEKPQVGPIKFNPAEEQAPAQAA